ncbi:uncharacterized protein LOC116603071 isoform X2 [Nematostella vectensis]|uniref:uncharacterized protein LOC116603071 isoform X2 n=1 Tax=Nematostella vectensis TaxID=45351 RepID=UPI00207707ED|nr:uncharacterized protein LOC116603071 isoform X2 [Nematostella vectensis]
MASIVRDQDWRLQMVLWLLVVRITVSGGDQTAKEKAKTQPVGPTRITRDGYSFSDPPCGAPLSDYETFCEVFIYPRCKSFPGIPQLKDLYWQVNPNESHPMIYVKWSPPILGYNDLWGFQTQIIEQTMTRPGYTKCLQINSKAMSSYTASYDANFASIYEVWLYSMPVLFNQTSLFIRKHINIPAQCTIERFRGLPKCCAFNNVTTYIDIDQDRDYNTFVNVSWIMTCDYVKNFSIYLASGIVHDCPRSAKVQNSTFYIVELSGECRYKNYTVEIQGVLSTGMTTETTKFLLSLPPVPVFVPTKGAPSDEDTMDLVIISAVFGLLAGLALVVFLWKLCWYRTRYIPGIRDVNDTQLSGTTSQDQYSVLLVHAPCCNACKDVVFYLYDYLNAFDQLRVTLDMVCQLKIRQNPLRWYESHIHTADRVIVVASQSMAEQDSEECQIGNEPESVNDPDAGYCVLKRKLTLSINGA